MTASEAALIAGALGYSLGFLAGVYYERQRRQDAERARLAGLTGDSRRITTLREFVARCTGATSDEVFDIFEFDTADSVRDEVMGLADSNSREPLRSAMRNLGFHGF